MFRNTFKFTINLLLLWVPRQVKGERIVFSTNVLGWLDIHMHKNGVRPLYTTILKINSKCIKDLSVSVKIIRILEENLEINIQDLINLKFNKY